MAKTEINHRQDIDQAIDTWMEQNPETVARLGGMTKDQLIRTCANAYRTKNELQQQNSKDFKKEVARFVEHSPKTREKILAAIKDEPQEKHYEIAHGIANRTYNNAQTFQAGKEQGMGAKFMDQFQRDAVPSQGQSQELSQNR